MEKKQNINTALGTALLFVIITSVVLFLSNLPIFISTGFLTFRAAKNYLLWVILIGIIVVLSVYAKILKQNFYSDILQNRIVRLITGRLVILEGIIGILINIILYINMMQIFMYHSHPYISAGSFLVNNIIVYGIPLFILSCEIILGIYFVKHTKNAVS